MNSSVTVPIFMACDDKYAPYLSVSVTSILVNTTDGIHFFIIDCGISQKNIKRIKKTVAPYSNCQINFIKLDADAIFKEFRTVRYLPLSMYARFLIPDLVPSIKKAIYLDVDTICFGNIRKLYDEQLDNKLIGACWEDFQEKNGVNFERNSRLGINLHHKYFCSGVLLIDAEKWRKSNVINTIFQVEKKLRNQLDCPDQDILNYVFQNAYQLLPSKYNVVNQIVKDYTVKTNKLSKEVFIRHFNGPKKPWHFPPETKESKNLLGLNYFWNNAKKQKPPRLCGNGTSNIWP